MAEAGDQEVVVRWDRHEAQLLRRLHGYYTDDALVDVTLWCLGRRFRAHRLLLAACCDHLERVLLEPPGSPTVVLHGLQPGDVRGLLQLCYTGQARVAAADLSRFLAAAKALGLRVAGTAALSVSAEGAAAAPQPAPGQQEKCFDAQSTAFSRQSLGKGTDSLETTASVSTRSPVSETSPKLAHKITVSKEQLPPLGSGAQGSMTPEHREGGAETPSPVLQQGIVREMPLQSDGVPSRVECRQTRTWRCMTTASGAVPPNHPAASTRCLPLALRPVTPRPVASMAHSQAPPVPLVDGDVSRVAGSPKNAWQVPPSPQAPQDAVLPGDHQLALTQKPTLPRPGAMHFQHSGTPLEGSPLSAEGQEVKKNMENAILDLLMGNDESRHHLNIHCERVDECKSKQRSKQHSCEDCGKTFSTPYSLKEHKRTHNGEKPFQCAQCGKRYSQRRNYRYHMAQHSGSREFASECPECGKTFRDRGYLSSHMRIHRNERQFGCAECGRRFNQRVAYSAHMLVHSRDRPHRCTLCDKAFCRKVQLSVHTRTHTGERPFKCQVCDRQFADRSNMRLHERAHWGVKPHQCPHCGRAFSRKGSLKAHMVTHSYRDDEAAGRRSPSALDTPASQQLTSQLRSVSVIVKNERGTCDTYVALGHSHVSPDT